MIDLNAPTPVTRRWYLQPWGLLTILVGASAMIILGYIGWQTYHYYGQIQDGTLDLSTIRTSGSSTTQSTGAAAANRSRVSQFADDPTLGPDDAELTVVLFEDFQCPFCGTLFPTLQTVIGRYSNQVRFVYRDFPITELHPNAQLAAEAGQCAAAQGQFWPYHDLLFGHQSALAATNLKQYARQVPGIDASAFDRCLDSGTFTAEVNADFADGLAAGVTGTPTIFFNGEPVAGVLSLDGFEQIIQLFLQP